MRKQLFGGFLLFALLSLAGCQRSPTGRRQLALASDSQMEQMGTQAFSEMKQKQKISNDPRMNAYLQCVAGAITSLVEPRQSWEVVVFDDPNVNAFALPGGKIGVFTGLLKAAKNQDQVAAVLGHEVGHVIAEHGKERVSESMLAQGGLAAANVLLAQRENPNRNMILAALGIGTQVGVLLPHSRTQESEADVIGLDLMARAGFKPREAVQLWHNMESVGGGQPPQFLSDHPSNENRIRTLEEKMADAEKEARESPHHPSCATP